MFSILPAFPPVFCACISSVCNYSIFIFFSLVFHSPAWTSTPFLPCIFQIFCSIFCLLFLSLLHFFIILIFPPFLSQCLSLLYPSCFPLGCSRNNFLWLSTAAPRSSAPAYFKQWGLFIVSVNHITATSSRCLFFVFFSGANAAKRKMQPTNDCAYGRSP